MNYHRNSSNKTVWDKIKNIGKHKKQKKSRSDVFEQWFIKAVSVVFCCFLAFILFHVLTNLDSFKETRKAKYVTLTQAELGTKEVYGTQKDSAGNVSEVNGLVPVSCYGDSFTNTADDSTASYPGILSVLAQRTVYNVAVNNDTIYEMAAREGGRPAVVSPFIIPTNKASTEVLVSGQNEKAINFDMSKNGGLNPCKIKGIEGLLSDINGTFYFTRVDSGEEELVLTPTTIQTRAMELRSGDICVFFLGDDDIYETPEKAVEVYKDMVNYLGDNQKYLVVGPVKGEIAELDAANKALATAFGDKFLDLRSYLIKDADTMLKIKLSEDDRVLANNNIVPYVYFTSDGKHFSAQGADAAGKATFDKLTSLGYFEDAIKK